jgi:hypothetical protein
MVLTLLAKSASDTRGTFTFERRNAAPTILAAGMAKCCKRQGKGLDLTKIQSIKKVNFLKNVTSQWGQNLYPENLRILELIKIENK